jgi:hypothetical protein
VPLIHQVLLPDLWDLGRPRGLGLVHRAVGTALRAQDLKCHRGHHQLIQSKPQSILSLTPQGSA